MSWTPKDYAKRRNTDPRSRNCDCGAPADVLRHNEFICNRCAALERAMWSEKQAVAHAQKVAKGYRVDKHNRPTIYASPFDPSINTHKILTP